MIQRIQTLYLFIVSALVAVTVLVPMASFAAGADAFELYAYGLKDAAGERVVGTLYMAILLDAACLLPLVTIFLYNRRMLQVRLCAVEAVLLLGAEAMMLAYFFLWDRCFAGFEFNAGSLNFTVALPVAGLLFCWLAVRGIMRDELMVRSLDRIR